MDRQAYLDKKNKSHGSESQEIWGQGEKLASQALTQRQALRSNDEAFLASQNERRRKRGLNLNVNNGRIYTFSPLSKSELENSLSWADSEISKLKVSGGAGGVAGSILKSIGKVSGPLYEKLQKNDNINSIEAFLLAADDFGQKSEKISELEAYKNTVQQYMDNIQFQEDIDKIKSDKYAENKFGAIFNIDNDKKLYFLNAGEEGYDNDFYYERSSRRDKLINELQEMGYDDIERYIKNYSDYRSDKTITPILEYISDSIVEHPVIGGTAATASNILISPMRGVGQTFDSIAEALGIHGYKAASLPAAASQVTTETVHSVINETFDNKYAAGFVRTLYNAAVSGSESMLAMGTFGKLGEAVLGLGAAADTYSQARERGLSDGQALMNGIAAGIFETLFEHWSLGNLRAFKAAPAASVKDFIKTVVFQAGIEGSEEILTDLANEAYDYMVNGGLSQYEQALNSGMTAGEYGKQFFRQLIETLATGALSGAGMTGAVTAPSVIGNEIGAVAGDIARGEEIRKTGDTYTVLDKAKEQGGKVSKAADKISKKLYDDKGVSDRTLGRIERKTSEAAYKETTKEREADIDKILDNELSSLSRKEKNAVRSSVLTFLKNPLSVAYEQQEVLESENGKKALELMAKYYDIRKEAKAKNKKMASEEKNEATAKDISEHIRNDTTDELVKNTFSGKHKDGYEVGIGAVKSIKEGDFEVVQDRETGATALLSDVKIENEEADILYKTLRERVGAANRIPMTLEAVNVALSLYEPNINRDARMYALWAHDASIAATVGLSYKAFVSSFDGRHKNYITDFQMEQVYKAAAGNLVTKSGVTRIGGRHLSKMETEALFLIDRTFRKYGIHCVAIDGLTDENGHAVNALLTKKDVIVLNLNADGGLLSVAAGHELFHWLKKNDKNSAEYLQNLVIAMLKADKNVDFDALYKQRANVYTDLNENELLEEIAAQYFGVVFSSESNIRKVVNEATDVEKGILRKIVGRLKSFIKNLKAALKEYGIIDKTVRAAVESDIGELEEMVRLFDVALSEAAKNKKPATDEGGVKASLSVIGLEEYSKESKNNIKMRGGLIVNSEAELRRYISEALNGNAKKNLHLGAIPKNIINQIEKDINTKIFKDKQYTFVVSYDDIIHISKHFSDINELTNEIIRLYDILSNYDSVECLIEDNGRKKLRLEKAYSHADYRSIEIVSNKTLSVDLISFYVTKKHNKKGSQSVPPATQGSLSGGARLPNSSVPQKAQTVNDNDMQSSKKDTENKINYSVKIDTDGNKFVDVDPELFDARDGESHAKTIARIIKERFNNLISVNGQQIQINKTTNDEWRRSNGADALRRRNSQGYFDKLKTIPYADEILKIAKDWIGEEWHHPRRDDIVEFARGNVYYRVGNNGYVADVIVAIRENGSAVLYDLDDIRAKKITDIPLTMASENSQRSAGTPVNDNISQPETEVKDKYSRQLNNTADNIEQLKAENESFAGYIDEVTQEIQDKLKNKKLPDVIKIFDRKELYKIAAKYNTYYEPNKNGGFSKKQYSNTEIADIIENVLTEVSQGKVSVQDAVTRLTAIQENVLQNGYAVEYEPGSKAFRKELRNKPIYLTAKDYNQLVEEFGGTRKMLRAASYHQLSFKEAETADESNISEIYNSLKEKYPDFIGWAESGIEMARELISTERALKPKIHYASEDLKFEGEIELEDAAARRALDILKEAFNVDLVQTDFQRQYNELQKVRQSLNEVKKFNINILENAAQRYREREEKNILTKRILRNTNRLSDMLRNETDQRHIPEKLKEPVMNFLNMFIYKNRNGRPEYYTNGTLNMVKLSKAYADYYNPTDDDGNPIPKSQYDEDIAEWIEQLALVFGDDVDIKKLTLEELQKVDKIVSHFSHIIKHENEMFIEGRRVKFTGWANTAIKQMYAHISKPEYKIQKKILDAEYGMLTPAYFFKYIGISTVEGQMQAEKLYEMFKDLQKGQDKWYRNVKKTKDKLFEIKEKYHYTDAWKRDAREFTLSSGEILKLTAEEIMYMHALWVRENGHINHLNHLLEGGIIVENDSRLKSMSSKWSEIKETHAARKEYQEKGEFTKDDIVASLKKNLTHQDLLDIFATLTDDMKGYSSALVEMLSTTGAKLGNEVSMELFGINKFTEKNYIPISVAAEYLELSTDKKSADTARLKNRSFTKRTTKNANATVYVRSITDIAAEHMQEMCLYNAMTIPVENLTRVFNYQLPADETYDENGNKITVTGNSFKEIFEVVYGERGLNYFKNFLRDINGGNQTPARDFTSKMMGMFKKAAVTGSLSVAVQQPSAIVRACALVDAKYFVSKPYNKADYEEMMKYNPVAGIKEIGRFDTGLGQTATEWILDDKNGFLDKTEDFLMFLPGMMDRLTWVHIWNAVKRETKAKNKELSGEKLLEKAAERFRDVIDYTQVYDSTLSRSGYMRDQGMGAKMATAFMAEPTLSYNLLRDSAVNFKNAPGQAIKGTFAFFGATLFNALLKSLITALRKDDDETNYLELYLSEVPSDFIDDITIINLLPVIKDVVSLIKGYDVKRPDMTLFENFLNSARVISNKIAKGDMPSWDEFLVLLGTGTAFTRIPLNNVFKDLIAAIHTVQGFGKSPKFSIIELLTPEKMSDSLRIYNAIIAKDEDAINRYKAINEESVKEYKKQGYSEVDAMAKAADNADSSFHSKVIEGLISEDIRIQEAAEARLSLDTDTYEELLEELAGLGFDKNDVIKAVDKYIASLEDKSYEQKEQKDNAVYTYNDLFRAVDGNDKSAFSTIYKYLKDSGKSKDSIQEKLRDEYAEEVYKAIFNNNSTAYKKYEDLFKSVDYSIDKVITKGLKEYDDTVHKAAEARYNMNFSEYENLANKLISKGFSESNVYGAIEGAMSVLEPEEAEDDGYISEPDTNYEYEYADMHRAIEQNNLTAMKNVINELISSGVKESNIKSSLSGKYRDKYKEAWKNADIVTIDRIRSILYSADVGYSESDFRKWEKTANDTQ